MTTEMKKFVNDNETTTPAQKAFILINKLGFAIFNVIFGKNGLVTFDTLSQFNIVESLSLNKAEQKVFDLFYDFNSTKNAIAALLHTIENKGVVTGETYKNQSKLTPAMEYPKMLTFGQFWAFLSPEQKEEAVRIADAWLKSEHIDETSFEFFFINGTKGIELKEGDYVMGYDAMTGKKAMTRIFQASPSGLVTAIDNGGHFTLGKSFKPEVVGKEQMPKEVTDILDELFDKLNDQATEQREYRFDGAMKAAEKSAELKAKEEAKAEKAKLADEAKKEADTKKAAEFKRLMALKLTSEDAISKAVGDLNAAKLPKENVEKVRAHIKAAKDALKAKAQEAKDKAKTAPNATTKGSTTATPPKAATPAKATPAPKADAAPKATTQRPNRNAKAPEAPATEAKANLEVVK